MLSSAKLLIHGDILCRLPLGNGQKDENENRPRESILKVNSLISDGITSAF